MTAARLVAVLLGGVAAYLGSNLTALGADGTDGPPSFEGVWQIIRPVTQVKTASGKMPPLRPAARRLYNQRIAALRAGNAASYDHTYLCKPMGEPRTGYEGQPFDIVQNERVIFIGYTWNRMVRFVYLADQHPELTGPAFYGSWIGRWDGSTLVFDGVGFNADTLLDRAGMPHSEDLHLVQRLRLREGGKQLEIRTHIEDAKTFTAAWDTVHTYKRLPGALIQEDICPQRLKLTIY
jgi:hypothetical protein